MLRQGRETLTANSVEDAGLEAEVLLRHTLSFDRVQFYLQQDRELSAEENENFRQSLRRRLNNEPTAYITGHREFYGRDFYVDNNVLIPRPESELLVETALGLAANRPVHTIADIGTGSGAIAVSLALSLPQTRIYAVDISPAALKVAQINCRKHGVTDVVQLLQGDLLDPLPEPVDMILANLPYVREEELPQVNTWHFEPSTALNGGHDGLDTIRRLCTQAGSKLRPGGAVLLEIGLGQSEAATAFCHHLFPAAEIKLIPDGNGIDRVVRLLTA